MRARSTGERTSTRRHPPGAPDAPHARSGAFSASLLGGALGLGALLGWAGPERGFGPIGALAAAAVADPTQALEPYTDTIPGTLVTFEMVPVPGGPIGVEGPDGTRTHTVKPFYIGRTEVTWDMFDVFMFGLDEPGDHPTADALARPSEPYDVPDYGWGRSGSAAISVTLHSARAFAEWLSEKTGHTYRLPTAAEWVRAATLAAGDARLTGARLDAIAWHAGNSGGRTRPVASLEPDALGLFDLFGNAGEWVTTEGDRPMIRGGGFHDAPEAVGPQAWTVQDESWTERDPQLPGSTWWLTDAPFVGFRLVREP